MQDYRQEELYRGEILYLASKSPEDLREISFRSNLLRGAKANIGRLDITVKAVEPAISSVDQTLAITPETPDEKPQEVIVVPQDSSRPDLQDLYQAVENAYREAA